MIVRRRQRRVDGIDAIVLSLSAGGLTTGGIAAHFAEVYGAKVSKDTISRITDAAVRARGHFPTEQAALKCVYLVTRSLDPTGRGRARWVTRWKPALNAFAITFDGRLNPTSQTNQP